LPRGHALAAEAVTSRTVIAALALICAIASARAQDFSAEDLARRTIERRAIEAVIWGMPAVNLDLMLQAMRSSIGRACRIGKTRRSRRIPT
jgi:hypothetical protein